MHSLTRRKFMRIGAGSIAAGAIGKVTLLDPGSLWGAGRAVAPSERIRVAGIGTGTRGCQLLEASLLVPGIECVAVCDLYDSRHEAAQEALQKQVPATRNYREILDRNDVDAVIVAVAPPQQRGVGGGGRGARQGGVLRKAQSANREKRVGGGEPGAKGK